MKSTQSLLDALASCSRPGMPGAADQRVRSALESAEHQRLGARLASALAVRDDRPPPPLYPPPC